jgi:hypothetical protein
MEEGMPRASLVALVLCAAARAGAQEPPAPIEVTPAPVVAPAPAPAPAAPAVAAAPAAHWYDEVQVNGFISFALTANFNDPKPAEGDTIGRNAYRAFDQFANTYELDVAELDVQRPATKPGDVGLRIDVAMGQTIPRVAAANGSSAGPFDLQQAYISYIMDIGNGLRLDAGKFVTPAGVEVIEGYDGYNDEYSHSFLFNFGPFTHTGLHLSYPFNKQVAGSLWVINGWDVLIDNNSKTSLGASLNLTPSDAVAVQVLYLGGEELSGTDPPWRHFLDVVASVKASDTVSFAGNFDYAKEDDTAWYGAAGYAKIGTGPDGYFGLRGELFADPDGAKTGVAKGQTLTEFTGDYTWKFTPNLVGRIELRWDHSSNDVFQKNDGAMTSSQVTLAANYLAMF